jgi:hypothetical protein
MKLKFAGISLLIVLFFSACRVQEDLTDLENNYHPDVAAPLFFAKTSLKDILSGSNATALKIDADSKMRLYYKGTVSERKAKDALKIFPSNGIPILFNKEIDSLKFGGDLQLYKVNMNKPTTMTLGCQMLSAIPAQEIEGYISSDNLTKNGVPFYYKIGQKMTTGAGNVFGLFSLDGYVVTFDRPDNTLVFKYQAKTKSTGDPVKLQVGAAIQNIAFGYCEAFMSQKSIDLTPGEVKLDFFEEQAQGGVKFENPRITVTLDNSYGFPMRTKINYIKAINDKGDTILLSAKGLTGADFDFPFPDLAKNEVGKTKTFKYDFTTSSSNIKEMLNSNPVKIQYSIDVLANPYAITSPGFVTDSTTLKIGVEVDIPFYGTSDNFKVKQKFENINFASALANIQEAELKLVTDNELPVGVDLEMDFLDRDGKVLTQLAQGKFSFIQAANIDAKGNVTSKTSNSQTINFDKTKTDILRKCEKIQLRYYFSTSNKGATPVQVLANQNLNIKMGVKAKL